MGPRPRRDCYRDPETEWRQRGYSRDHRPDLPQWVLCVAVNAKGWPIAWEIFPSNTADQKALGQVVAVLRQRFHLRRVMVVAKQGPKAVIGNCGYARFLKVAKGSVSVDEAAVKRDARPGAARSGKALFTSPNLWLFQNYFWATVEDEP